MSTPLRLILVGSAIIVVAGLLFHRQLAKIPIGYALVIAVIGTEKATARVERLKDKYGL